MLHICTRTHISLYLHECMFRHMGVCMHVCPYICIMLIYVGSESSKQKGKVVQLISWSNIIISSDGGVKWTNVREAIARFDFIENRYNRSIMRYAFDVSILNMAILIYCYIVSNRKGLLSNVRVLVWWSIY